jgi:hypothetical protein
MTKFFIRFYLCYQQGPYAGMYKAVQEAISRATTVAPSRDMPPDEFRSRAYQVRELVKACYLFGDFLLP